MLTAGHKTVDERFFAGKEKLLYHLLPVITIEHQLIFKEVNEGPLISVGTSAVWTGYHLGACLLSFAQEITPIM